MRPTHRGSAHTDLARLDLFALVERDGQDAVVELGVDGLLVDAVGEREAPLEAVVAAFAEEPVTLRVSLLLLGQTRLRARGLDLLPAAVAVPAAAVGVF